jgi:hypothetical protein
MIDDHTPDNEPDTPTPITNNHQDPLICDGSAQPDP